jgi:hypothetical protein
MNRKLLLTGFLLCYSISPIFAQYQFNLMEDYLEIGAGNYFIHLDKEAEEDLKEWEFGDDALRGMVLGRWE